MASFFMLPATSTVPEQTLLLSGEEVPRKHALTFSGVEFHLGFCDAVGHVPSQ